MSTSTVLVIEDQERLADLYETWLSDEYEVRTAYSVVEAHDELSADVDIALIDRRLPDGSGDEIVTAIREHGFDCRVAMVTAVDPDFDILEMGFDTYVVKPVQSGDLHDVVEQLLTRSRFSDEVQRYYALASKRATLEAEKSADELDASTEYADLLEELTDLQIEIQGEMNEMGSEDFVALFHDL